MFSYYGSKSKIVNLYPKPKFDKIIEPFAGSARYSLKYWNRDVLLIDKHKPIVDLWNWLKEINKSDLDSLPVLSYGDNLKDYNLSREEKLFLSFCINEGSTGERNTVTKRSSTKVGFKIKSTKEVLHKIKHWDIRLGCYSTLNNEKATWFIDPPYVEGGQYYPKSSKFLDYNKLSEWCRLREGQLIVCENNNADWLPFVDLKSHWGGIKKSKEKVYIR